jgi:hypothetical protein
MIKGVIGVVGIVLPRHENKKNAEVEVANAYKPHI